MLASAYCRKWAGKEKVLAKMSKVCCTLSFSVLPNPVFSSDATLPYTHAKQLV
jgi:hypothetical protein